jgi:asparagine synthase (glutamine-hydrolysing)
MDERWFIEKVLEKTGAEGNFDFPDAGRIWNELPKIIRQQDGPSGVFSVYARWSLAQRAKARGVKVLLDGDGSDVLLAGHHRYYGVFFLELAIKGRILRLLSEVRSAAAIGGIRDLFSYANTTLGGGILGHVPVSFQMGMRHLIFRVRGRSTDKALAPAFDKAYEKYGLSCISQHYRRNNASLNQHLGSDLAEFGNSIKYSDSLYTPFGIETRAPFLDHRLIEYVFSLPASLKIRDGWTKWLLRQSMQGILPEEIRLRKDKIGYGVPLETWLKTNRKQIKALFSGNVLSRQYINLAFIKDHLDDLLSSKKTCWEVWRYVNLEIWLREFFGDR